MGCVTYCFGVFMSSEVFDFSSPTQGDVGFLLAKIHDAFGPGREGYDVFVKEVHKAASGQVSAITDPQILDVIAQATLVSTPDDIECDMIDLGDLIFGSPYAQFIED